MPAAKPPLSKTLRPKTLRTAAALADAGLVALERLPALEAVAARYAVAITPAMAELIEAADDGDPIARQFVPHESELVALPVEAADPVGDDAFSPVPGVVHRYPDRALLKITHTCAVYCRFCFRREMVGPAGIKSLNVEALDAAIGYIAGQPQIWEVIVTGGDPLVLSPRRLRALMDRLAGIDHLKVVRFHTRLPVVDPAAVTDDLVAALRSGSRKSGGQAVYVALHANHARELPPAARAACARLVDAGIPMLGQTVLLRGINDDAETLGDLMRAMVETRIKPYYLHQGDLAPGTSHLRVPIAEGQAILKTLRGRWSGLCQPTYVLDIPGGHGKSPIGPGYLSEGAEGLVVEDYNGHEHTYPLAEAPKP